MTFEQWMKRVDAVIFRMCGLSHDDLEDYCYLDAFEDGETPSAVAKAALLNAGW